jgi:hypothetical protein
MGIIGAGRPFPLAGQRARRRLGVPTGWDKHAYPLDFSFPLRSLVDCRCIVGAVGHEGGHPVIDLVQGSTHPRAVGGASAVSERQTVRASRLWIPASYSVQCGTR